MRRGKNKLRRERSCVAIMWNGSVRSALQKVPVLATSKSEPTRTSFLAICVAVSSLLALEECDRRQQEVEHNNIISNNCALRLSTIKCDAANPGKRSNSTANLRQHQTLKRPVGTNKKISTKNKDKVNLTGHQTNTNNSRGKNLHLRQRRTLKQLNDRATKQVTFLEKYDVHWNEPPLGEGSFGAVYEATNRSTGERVAIKRIPKEYTNDAQFQQEMEALLYLQSPLCGGGHPGICQLREHFADDKHSDYYVIVMDLVSGGELFDHLVQRGAFSEADAARLVRETAEALAFLHGVGVVHGDLKPENLMLSSSRGSGPSDAVIKLVDFGNARIITNNENYEDEDNLNCKGHNHSNISVSNSHSCSDNDLAFGGITVAYCPPEVLAKRQSKMEPSMDMWALGVILYIMLTGLHPYDLEGNKSDEEVAATIRSGQLPPLKNSPITAHLTTSAIDLLGKLMCPDPNIRLDAHEMLDHAWVKGETANRNKMAGSDKKLSLFRRSGLIEATVFRNLVYRATTPDGIDEGERGLFKRTSLIERSFQWLDPHDTGRITQEDLERLEMNSQRSSDDEISGGNGSNDNSNSSSNPDSQDKGEDSNPLSFSGFSELLAESMKNKYFPKGRVVYREGDIGNHMYFINSGTILVVTKEGSKVQRGPGDFFGEGALLHPRKIRSATIRCLTPVHALQISRAYFEKYLAQSDTGLFLELREKDKIRKRNRAKTILRLQSNLQEHNLQYGDVVFEAGENTDSLFIVEAGRVDVVSGDDHKTVFSAMDGNILGEHAAVMGRPRNCTALCATPASQGGCRVHEMYGRDFRDLMDVSPDIKGSLRDLTLRRDFKKAVVTRLKKEFPYHDPREAFDAVRNNVGNMSTTGATSMGGGSDGCLTVRDVGTLMKELTPDYTEEEILEVIRAINLSGSGSVTFGEFKKVFVADIKTSASI